MVISCGRLHCGGEDSSGRSIDDPILGDRLKNVVQSVSDMARLHSLMLFAEEALPTDVLRCCQGLIVLNAWAILGFRVVNLSGSSSLEWEDDP